jgi:hypothetical protein
MTRKAHRTHALPSLPSLALAPPEVRLANQSVMRTTWRDPDDIAPSAARAAKEITGWRTFCPLRRMLRIQGSSITVEHILAADRLRQAAAGIVFGFSGRRELVPVQAVMFGPRTGFGVAALRQAKSWPIFMRAMKIFCEAQRELLAFVVLENQTINRWVAKRREQDLPANAPLEMGKLIACLDCLVEHFRSEVEQDLERGVEV